jgi:hypothetical protein
MQPRCSHFCPGHLAINHPICPLFLINKHIFQVRECQAEITARGGIFASKQRAREKGGGLAEAMEWKDHHAPLWKWRAAKLAAISDVVALKEMERKVGEERAEHGKCRGLVMEAVEKWRNEEESLLEVPGCNDSREDGESSPNDHESSPKGPNTARPRTLHSRSATTSTLFTRHQPPCPFASQI